MIAKLGQKKDAQTSLPIIPLWLCDTIFFSNKKGEPCQRWGEGQVVNPKLKLFFWATESPETIYSLVVVSCLSGNDNLID